MNIVSRARRYLASMPASISGAGGHDQTFSAASILVSGFSLNRETALSLLHEYNSRCQPPWSEAELIHKIDSAASAASAPSAKPAGYLIGEGANKGTSPLPYVGHHAAPVESVGGWPSRSHRKIIELLDRSFYSLADLEECSPIPPKDLKDPYALIDNLFLRGPDPNPLLCFATDIRQAETRKRSEWQGEIEKKAFLVPNTMSKRKGKTKDGRDSVRCLGNTSLPRQYIIIETDFTVEKDAPLFDFMNARGASLSDVCSSVLLFLAEYAPLVMAVHSGNKSLHGWFKTCDQSEAQLKEFMRFSCIYGADKSTFTRCQLVRMPCGTRDNGRPQNVHYFDPSLLSH